ncbi:MAG: signal recognition particle-docking protein FtsY [Chitinophagales bacterium]|nr:signal recognition particle-docking protein FtsY [Bacteroidota bacterium]MCB9042943.1 signal recognition particle-docking protein FtsY [Chitinophagales bacterium]
MGFFDKFFTKEKKEDLDQGLKKSSQGIFEKLSKAVAGKTKVDEELLDEIEYILVSSDVDIQTTIKIIDRLEEKVAQEKYLGTEDLYRQLKEVVIELLDENNSPDLADFGIPEGAKKPYVILVVGVNGVGKTTSIGKLAYQLKKRGLQVLLGAGDTFRAAAISQLKVWGERVGVPVVAKEMGSDPASTAYEAVQQGIDSGADVVIIDTAGRLHNKIGLMNELSKIKKVIQKHLPDAPHEVLLVLDGSTGQNAFEQAKQFMAATDVTALCITKLDGTAKGGVVLGIADQFKIPIKYIGVGEQMEQLQVFNKRAFAESLFQ